MASTPTRMIRELISLLLILSSSNINFPATTENTKLTLFNAWIYETCVRVYPYDWKTQIILLDNPTSSSILILFLRGSDMLELVRRATTRSTTDAVMWVDRIHVNGEVSWIPILSILGVTETIRRTILIYWAPLSDATLFIGSRYPESLSDVFSTYAPTVTDIIPNPARFEGTSPNNRYEGTVTKTGTKANKGDITEISEIFSDFAMSIVVATIESELIVRACTNVSEYVKTKLSVIINPIINTGILKKRVEKLVTYSFVSVDAIFVVTLLLDLKKELSSPSITP